MIDAFETKILRSQILLLEAERIIHAEGGSVPAGLRDTLNEIAADDILDYDEAAKFLKMERETLRGYVSHRRIPFVRLNGGKKGGVRFSRHDLIAWVQSKKTEARG